MTRQGHSKRGGQPKTLAALAGKLTRPIFGGRGFSDGAIVNDWPAIVGDKLAAHSAPGKITYPQGRKNAGTLHLKIDSGSLAMELQHLGPVLIDRINVYFGFAAVAEIRITQGPLPERPPPPAPMPPLAQAEEKKLGRRLSGIADADLGKTLEDLGRAVIAREAARNKALGPH